MKMKMHKSLLYLIIIMLFASFTKIDAVSANLVCNYKNDNDSSNILVVTISTEVDADGNAVSKIVSIDNRWIENGEYHDLSFDTYTIDWNVTNECLETFKRINKNQFVQDTSPEDGATYYSLVDYYETSGNEGNGVFDNSNSDKETLDFMEQDYVSCGGVGDAALVKTIPSIIPNISSSLYNIILVVVPVVMVLMGMTDLVKGVISQKEDEIRKGKSSLIKRTIMGVVTFLVVLLVKMLINLVAGGNSAVRIVSCLDCFVNNDCTPVKKSSVTKPSATQPSPGKNESTPTVS